MPTKFSAAERQSQLQAAAEANHDLQVLAAGLGVPVAQLIRCLIKAVGFAKLIQCLRSGDFLSCLIENVDIEKVIDCALAVIPGGGGGDGFE